MSYLTLLVQKGHTWKKFSNTERWVLIQALLLLPVVAILLKFGAKHTHFLLSIFLPSELSSHSTSQILTTANMVKIAAKYYSWATCLRRAFVLWFLLRRQGIGAELKIGTRLATEFQAHAWVEYQGFVVGESQATKQHYVAFDKLETKLSQNKLTHSVSWRLEDELLLCCAKTSIDTATTVRVNKLLQSDKKIDWEYLLQQACQHGVFLLLYQNLIANYSECIPKNIQPTLQAYSHVKTARNLFLSKKLCQLFELFKNHDIQVIPFKGSVLAASAYKNLALREFCAMKNIYSCLKPGGIFRIIVPDLEQYISIYINNRADDKLSHTASHAFMMDTWLGHRGSRSNFVSRLLEGFSNSRHQWMWDEPSLLAAFTEYGFQNIRRCYYGDWSDSRFAAVEKECNYVNAIGIEGMK